MNKNEMKKRISNIKSQSDFEDIKSTLINYKSISNRVDKLKWISSQGIYIKTYISIGGNKKDLIKTLNQIVDDFKLLKEVFYTISFYGSKILDIFVNYKIKQ